MTILPLVQKKWRLPNSLLSGLTEWWSLAEPAGTRIGSKNGFNLTSSGGVSGAPGPNGGLASAFTSSLSRYLSLASSASIQNDGSTGFEFCMWVKPISLSTNSFMFSKDAVVDTANRQFSGAILLTSGFPYFEVHNTTGLNPITFNSTIALTVGTYYMLNFWYDTSDLKARISVNNTTPTVSSALAGTLNTSGSTDFQLGAKTADPTYSNIVMCKFGYWNRILTSAERTLLYNNGNGLNY